MKLTDSGVTRRTVLRGVAGAATAGCAVSAATPVTAQTSGSPDYGGWFENTSNYDGTVDKTGQQTVKITVGADGNNGNFAFGPAAVQVDPGTKIVWEWTGKGSVHNVVAEDGRFESEMTDEAGHTFEYTVEETGIITYACAPHKTMGMKGALVVGDVTGGGSTGNPDASQPSEPDYGGWFENVSNYEKTIDKTGQREVTVIVGAEGNNGSFAFDPPAIRIDPGTTVIWEWSGKGGVHNVVAEDGSFRSEMTDESGFTFEQTFDEPGTVRYACAPHEQMGMKGALVIGDPRAGESSSTDPSDVLAIGGGFGLVGVLFAMFAFGAQSGTRGRRDDSTVQPSSRRRERR